MPVLCRRVNSGYVCPGGPAWPHMIHATGSKACHATKTSQTHQLLYALSLACCHLSAAPKRGYPSQSVKGQAVSLPQAQHFAAGVVCGPHLQLPPLSIALLLQQLQCLGADVVLGV